MDAKYLRPEADVTPELELWYKLNDFVTTGEVHDYSGNEITGAVKADARPSHPAFVFDDTSDYIDTENTFQAIFRDSFSISMYARGVQGTLFGAQNASAEDQVLVHIDSNTLNVNYSSDTDDAIAVENSDSFSNANVYHHVVVTFEADTQIRLYVDSVERTLDAGNNGDASGVTFADYTSTITPYIGAMHIAGEAMEEFTGNIGDVRIYSKLLTPVEVKNIYELTRWRYSS